MGLEFQSQSALLMERGGDPLSMTELQMRKAIFLKVNGGVS